METATASWGNRGSDDDPNKNSKGKEPEKPHFNPTPPKPKLTRGRRPIKIERIEDEEARLSTFSKRKSGIYKKANDIVTLTGVHLGLAMITPAKRAFSYSDNSIDDIINRFLTKNYAHLEQQQQQQQQQPHEHHLPMQPLPQQGMKLQQMMMQQGGESCRMEMVETILEAHRKSRVNSLNQKHNWLVGMMQVEREKTTALVEISRPFQNPDGSAKCNTCDWWELMSNEILTDEDINRLAEEIQKFIVRIGESRQMRELRNIMMTPSCADEANPSYPPPLPMQGYEVGPSCSLPLAMQGYEAGLSYLPPAPTQRFMINSINNVPSGAGDEVDTTYNPPTLLPHMQGMIGNTNVHEHRAIFGGMHSNEEDPEDLASHYFNNDEGPRAGDF